MTQLNIISAEAVREKRKYLKKAQLQKIKELEIKNEILALLEECLNMTQTNIFAAIDNIDLNYVTISLPPISSKHHAVVKSQLIKILEAKGYFLDGDYMFWDRAEYEGFQE